MNKELHQLVMYWFHNVQISDFEIKNVSHGWPWSLQFLKWTVMAPKCGKIYMVCTTLTASKTLPIHALRSPVAAGAAADALQHKILSRTYTTIGG